MVREVIVDWTGPGSGGKLSVFNFHEGGDIDDQRAALGTFLSDLDGELDNAVGYSVRQSGREMNTTTGVLTGEWTDAGSIVGTGTSIGQATADVVQVLCRWSTGVVVDGRFLKGRTFIPGLESNGFTDGNLAASTQGVFNVACLGLATALSGFSIWHRPVNGAGGSLHAVVAGSVWGEAAVLRRRRG